MRRAMIVLACCAPLALAACQTTSGAAGAVSQVQNAARQACGFLPTVDTVSALLGKSDKTKPYTDIAAAICAAVQLNPMTEGPRGGRTVPKVHGVSIRGQFVR